jgi:beta-lactamase class A
MKTFKVCLLLLISFVSPVCAQQATASKPSDLLKTKLLRISQAVSADWGIYIKPLSQRKEDQREDDRSEEIAINADQVMDTMSVIKIPLLVDAFRLVDAGKLNPADRIVMTTADKRFGTGVLRTLDPGLNLSFRDAMELMIIQSDNTGTDMTFSRVGGPAHVNQTMRELGLNSINAVGTAFDWFRALGAATDPNWEKMTPEELFTRGFPKNQTEADVERFHFEGKHPFGLSSARDMGGLLEMMATNRAASQKSCEQMIHIMGRQQFRTRIPKYLSDVQTPHKTGDFPPYIANDVGYIQTDKARVVVVFFSAHHRGTYAELEDAIARMSEQVWAFYNYGR